MGATQHRSSGGKTKGSWGGAREGAGRKKTSPFVSHLKRPRVEGRKFPVFVTLRLRTELPSFRAEEIFTVFHKASLRARRFGLRIIEYRVEDKAINLLCEFQDSKQLEHSFKSLNTALAVAIKKAFMRKNGVPHNGPIFLGRFMMEEIDDTRRYKNVLRELLLLDPDAIQPEPIIGKFSSAALFSRWRDLLSHDGEKMKPQFILKSGKTLTTQLTHIDDQKIIREITASPQFRFTKLALTV